MNEDERNTNDPILCQNRFHEKVSVVGGFAAFFTTVAFAPQAFKVLSKSGVSGLSSVSYGLYSAGCALWIWYGAKNNMTALCWSCGIGLIFSLVIFCATVFPNSDRFNGIFFSRPSGSTPFQQDTALFPETSRLLPLDEY